MLRSQPQAQSQKDGSSPANLGTIYLPQRHSPFDWTGTDAGFIVREKDLEWHGEAVPNPARSPSLRQVYWSANLLVWKADPVPALTTKTRIAQTNNSNQSHDDILLVGCNALQCLHFK